MAVPNLLFIYCDELAMRTLATYGNDKIDMPNLNRFAAESIVFDQAYVTQPVCTPSRSTLLTGLYPHTNGCTENNVPLKTETKCLPEMLTPDEFITGHFGKWHLGDEIFQQHGFDEWIAIDDGYCSYYGEDRDQKVRSDYHHFLIENGRTPKNGDRFGRGEIARLPEELSKPAFLAREATRFLGENKDRPFVLFVNFFEPHMPFTGPRDAQYDVSDIPLPENYDNPPTEAQPLKTRLISEGYCRNGFGGMDLSTDDGWRRLIGNYWGLCSQVDTHAGAILDALDQNGLRDNTIVVFTSDHGDMMGSHKIVAKCVMYEEAVRVPMIIRLPGQQEGRRIMGPMSQIDVVPTLLDLMGQSVPSELQGKSLVEAMTSGSDLETPVVIEWNGPNNGLGDVSGQVQVPEWMTAMAQLDVIRASTSDEVRSIITHDGWKFNCSPLGEHELYNLNDDPYEKMNLFEKERGGELVAGLLDQLHEWQKRTGDKAAIPKAV